jgi:hypothetical protein
VNKKMLIDAQRRAFAAGRIKIGVTGEGKHEKQTIVRSFSRGGV